MTKVSGSQGKPKRTKTAAAASSAAKTKVATTSEKPVSTVIPLASSSANAAPARVDTAETKAETKAASKTDAVDSAASVEAVSTSPVLVTSTIPVVTGPELKKRELLERVVTRSGVKKRDAKLVVEAMLAVMGEALAEGQELNLQPFGKLKINRVKESANGRILNCRLRQGAGDPQEDKEVLAEADD